VAEQAQTGVVLLVVLLLQPMFPACFFSDAILRIIGRQGAAILVRCSWGSFFAPLAVKIVLDDIGSGKFGHPFRARFCLDASTQAAIWGAMFRNSQLRFPSMHHQAAYDA